MRTILSPTACSLLSAITWILFMFAVAFFHLASSETLTTGQCPHQSNNNNRIRQGNTANTTDLDINIAFLSSLTKGGGKRFSGAFFLALDDLNEKAVKENLTVTFNYTFRDVKNQEDHAMKEMADLHCSRKISAFIGPDVYCKSAGLLATGFNVPYITYNCDDSHKETSQLLLVNVQISFTFVARFIAALLDSYKWKSFYLIAGSSVKWQSVAKQLKTSVATRNISINGDLILDENDAFGEHLLKNDAYKDVIKKTRFRTRVYVFLGDYNSLVPFVWQMAKQGLTDSGEYAVVAADDSKIGNFNDTVGSWDFLRKHENLTDNMPQLAAFRNVLVVRHMKSAIEVKTFEDGVFNRTVLPPINLAKAPSNFTSRIKIPNEAYQLYDATMIYGQAVMDLMRMPGADPKDARQIINYLRCRFHNSSQGGKLFIHSNGESEGSYKVETYVTATNPDKMAEVGYFNVDDNNVVFKLNGSVLWVNGNPPRSDPDCGFDGKLCPTYELAEWKIGIVVAAVLTVLLFTIVIFILRVRHYMYEQKLERLAWKIERVEIQILNPGQCLELTTPCRPRKKDSYSGNQLGQILLAQDSDSDIISDASCISDVIPLGIYRGTNVAVKQLTRRNLELTRAVKKQLQLRKEMTHENINRFIGACVEIPYLYIVTQFCPRRSLQDILRNEDSPLDDMFITSLVQDLIRGMSFIHDSEICCHGNLKSSNCLVDSRWTVKITDFGLSALGSPDDAGFDDEKINRGLLWTAPELLRSRHRNSHSASHNHHFYHGSLYSNNNNNNNNSSTGGGGCSNSSYTKGLTGSQKGDVYSFAIILYELYGKSGPWGNIKMTNKQIIDCLRSQSTPLLRPDTSSLTCDVNMINLIHACWHDEPDIRPDFKYGIRNRFKPIQQGFLKSNIFDNMLAMMEKYANNLEVVVAERTEQLRLEKKMTENLLLRMLPRSVAEKLKRGHRVQPEQYEVVSIYFSDIVGFTELSAESTPMEVVDLLNDLYTCFDSIIEEFDVYKVETIGDAYMVVSGLPIRNGDRHAGEIASMSLLLLEAIRGKHFMIKNSKNYTLKIRIGIHSGPCCAGVVGLKMPRYCLFGDTVNTASRMESTGEALKIHCSNECKNILDKLGGYHLEERGYTEMKGKGSLLTYFLLAEDQNQRYQRINNYKKMGNAGRCVSSSNLDYTGKIYSFGGKGVDYNNSIMNNKNLPSSRNHQVYPQSSIASLNTTMDSTWSENLEDAHELQSHLTFTSSTLPRASIPRHHNPQMSPIAEDPTGLGERSLEKTVSYPDSGLHESITLETDAHIEGGFGMPCLSPRSVSSNHNSQNSRFSHRSRLGSSGLESFDEDKDMDDDYDDGVELRLSRTPETKL